MANKNTFIYLFIGDKNTTPLSYVPMGGQGTLGTGVTSNRYEMVMPFSGILKTFVRIIATGAGNVTVNLEKNGVVQDTDTFVGGVDVAPKEYTLDDGAGNYLSFVAGDRIICSTSKTNASSTSYVFVIYGEFDTRIG